MILYDVKERGLQTDCLIIPMFQQKTLDTFIKDLDKQCNESITHAILLDEFDYKKGATKLIITKNTEIPRVLLVGCGNKEEFSIKDWKEVVGKAIIILQQKKYTKLSLYISQKTTALFTSALTVSEATIAIEIAAYSYDEHKTKEDQVTQLKQVTFVSDAPIKELKLFTKALQEGKKLGQAINQTRHLGNIPPTIMTPDYLVKEAKKLDKQFEKISTTIYGEAEMKKLGMGCLLGVARGSRLKPAFIIIKYNGAKKDEKPSVLVGKGITFDSGGLSLKPGAYMVDMKFDMLGAATVFGVMQAAADLGLKRNIIGVVPSCENMPGGDAYRPDDILVAMNGKSVLIENTDAEGRLILADALSYVHKFNPKEVIDFATLTGACVVALGNERSGLFTPEDTLADNLISASKKIGEQLWRLPVGPEYSNAMKSEIADIKNTGDVGGRGCGGASTAAAFLQFFTINYQDKQKKAYKWAHVDLSSSYFGGKGKPYIRGGANGFGVQTMIEYLKN